MSLVNLGFLINEIPVVNQCANIRHHYNIHTGESTNNLPVLEIEFPNKFNRLSIAYYSDLITFWLFEVENEIASTGFSDQAGYANFFSDANISSHPFEQIIVFHKNYYRPYDYFLLGAFYKGLFRYLSDNDRWQRFDAAILRLYAAWQWYYFIRAAVDQDSNTSPKAEISAERQNDIIEAHQVLSGLLESGEWTLSGAANHLAHAASSIDRSCLVYRMRIQMVLEGILNPKNPEQPVFSPDDLYSSPSLWKGLVRWDNRYINNDYAINLHPLFKEKGKGGAAARCMLSFKKALKRCDFDTALRLAIPQSKKKQDKGGAAALRMLATEWALKRYDFDTALRLANLQSKKRLNLKNWSITLVLILVTTLILVGAIIGSTSLAMHSGRPADLRSYILQWGVIAALLIAFSHFFDWRFLSRFGLPRLIGGIFIGYSAMIFQDDAAEICNAFWSNGGVAVAFLWLAVALAGGYYLINDIQPYTGNYTETFHRVIFMLPIFFLTSASIGFFLLPIFTTAFSDQLRYPLQRLVFFGPAGFVDLHCFLVFTPLALLVGLVTQFLFEEKTITSSVWPLEHE